MATKLLRLANDKKGTTGNHVMEDDYKEQIENLERKNANLIRKLQLSQNQMNVQKQRSGPLIHSARGSVSNTNLRTIGGQSAGPGGSVRESRAKESAATGALQTARMQISALEQTIRHLSEQSRDQEQSIGRLKEDLLVKDANHEREMQAVVQQLTSKQRDTLRENIDLIRNQRELREKQHKITTLEARIHDAETGQEATRSANRQLMSEVERLTREIGVLEQKHVSLLSDHSAGSKDHLKLLQLQHAYDDVKRDSDVIKDSNEKLMQNACSGMTEQTWLRQEQKLRAQINHLEALLQQRQREQLPQRLEQTDDSIVPRMQGKTLAAAPTSANVNGRHTAAIGQATGFTSDELEEAVMLLRDRKSRLNNKDVGLEFLQHVKDGENKDISRQLQHSEAAHAETIEELEKTRKLLAVQYRINKDYRSEVNEVTERLGQIKTESEQRLTEYAKLLDIRAARIRKLEAQIQDMAYGVKPKKALTSTALEADQVVEVFSADQNFAVQAGAAPSDGNAVEGKCTIELHQHTDGQYRTLAAGILNLAALLHTPDEDGLKLGPSQTTSRWSGQVDLVGVSGTDSPLAGFRELCGEIIGRLDYWVRLCVPMPQAIRLYKDRCRGLPHSKSSRSKQTQPTKQEEMSKPGDPLANQLTIHITEASGLQSHQKDRQPSPYFVYQFFDSPEKDSKVHAATDKPRFDDKFSFPVRMTSKLDRYLRTQTLRVYLLDDAEPNPAESCLGVAKIPLLTLATTRNQGTIDGVFELQSLQNESQTLKKPPGTIQVRMSWQRPYQSGDGLDLSSGPPLASINFQEDSLQQSSFQPSIVQEANEVQATHTTNQNAPTINTNGPKTVASSKLKQNGGLDEEACEIFAQLICIGDDMDSPSPKVNQKRRQSMSETQLSATQQNCSNSTVKQSTGRTHSQKRSPMDEETMEIFAQLIQDDVTLNQTADGPGITESKLTSQSETVQQSAPKPKRETSREKTELPGGKTGRRGIVQAVESSPERPKDKSRRMNDSTLEDKPNTPVASMLAKQENKTAIKSSTKRAKNPSKPIPKQRGTKRCSDSSSSGLQNLPEATEPSDLSQVSSIAPDELEKPHLTNRKTTQVRFSTMDNLNSQSDDSVTVKVHQIVFERMPEPFQQDGMRRVFVEYRFLGFPDPLETASCPLLPAPGTSGQDQRLVGDLSYSQTFAVDFAQHYENRQHLASSLLPDDPNQGQVTFTLVAEPSTAQSADCIEVGVARVDLRRVLQTGKEPRQQCIPVYPIGTTTKTTKNPAAIGHLCLSIYCLTTLQAIMHEMPKSKLAV